MKGMKRLITTLAALSFLVCPAVSFSSYLVKLKNGQEFVISEYWEEGSRIKFYYHGGVVRVEKDQVEAIEESDLSYEEVETPEPQAAQARPQSVTETAVQREARTQVKAPAPEAAAPGPMVEPAGKTGPEKGKPEEETDLEYYRDKRSVIQAELDQALESYFDALSRKDKNAADEARGEINALSKELFDLQEELDDKTDGQLPEWWKKL